jgi:hypothetical protein
MSCYLHKESNLDIIDNGHKDHYCSTCKNSEGIGLGCELCSLVGSCHYLKKE